MWQTKKGMHKPLDPSLIIIRLVSVKNLHYVTSYEHAHVYLILLCTLFQRECSAIQGQAASFASEIKN